MLMAYSGLSSLCHGLQTLDRRRNVVELGGELLLVLLQGPEKVTHLVQAELDVCFQPFLGETLGPDGVIP